MNILELRAALEGWWMKDGVHARASNTYTRHGENRARAAEACFDDYDAGAHDAFAELVAGRQVAVERLIQRYEKHTKGQRIDVHSYRLGVQRVASEWHS